jgi:acetate kinase
VSPARPCPSGDRIVVLNAGSSSLKFAVFEVAGPAGPQAALRGEIESLGHAPHFVARDASGRTVADRHWDAGSGAELHALLGFLVSWIDDRLGPGRLCAVGHRVATGGLTHSEPVRVDAAVVAHLHTLVPLAPLHLPRNLEPMEVLARLHPGLPQVACFDTAFHRTMPERATLYGLPRALSDAGARRYGYHGLSYEFIAGELPRIDPRAAAGRTIVAHLGSGASLCALQGGRSIATTMGFSPLSGLVMATRPGELDAGLLLWLLRRPGMDVDRVETMLYRDSGLAGVSGLGGDMRTLLASEDPRAREAVELFVHRIVVEIGGLAAALQGLDAIVFTAGIGEHAAEVRERVCRQCAWLGIGLDTAANARGGPCISRADSAVTAWVVPTDEELTIARHVVRLTAAAA